MIIKNGTILSPGTCEEYRADIKIANGIITEIGAPGSLRPEHDREDILDAASCIIAPGLVDVHVHFRDPGYTWKEDLHTGARAAAAGGFTTVFCMANTNPPVDNQETLSDLLDRAGSESVRVRFTASVTKGLRGAELTDFETLAALGACGFTDDGIPLTDAKLTEAAMKRAKALGLPISFHEEDPAFIEKPGANRTAPAIAEDLLVARDCMLSRYTGAVINIQHISSAASAALVRTAKALGAPVFAEATPHHFSLTEDAVQKYGTCAKMNPPLRTEEDRRAIIEGLRDGTIDIIATDHAPHSMKEKKRENFFEAPSGIIGLETSLGLGITNLVRPGHLTLLQLLTKMTVNPARLYRMNALAIPGKLPEAINLRDISVPSCNAIAHASGNNSGMKSSTGNTKKAQNPAEAAAEAREDQEAPQMRCYGSIFPGCAADLVIFNPNEAFTAGNYQSKSENTPFTGMQLYGKIHYTICNGSIVWEGQAEK